MAQTLTFSTDIPTSLHLEEYDSRGGAGVSSDDPLELDQTFVDHNPNVHNNDGTDVKASAYVLNFFSDTNGKTNHTVDVSDEASHIVYEELGTAVKRSTTHPGTLTVNPGGYKSLAVWLSDDSYFPDY